jgi:hypothetical protein
LFHDTTNHRLGVGTVSPDEAIHVHGSNPDIKVSSSTLANKSFQIGFDGSGGHPLNMSLALDHAIQFKTAGGDARLVINSTSVTCKQGLVVEGAATFSGLPTSDPGVAGQLWNDSGTLKISS